MKYLINRNKFKFSMVLPTVFIIPCIYFSITTFSSAEEKPGLKSEIEKALFYRTEFFGAAAIVPFPTAQARENLAKLQADFPGEAEIYQQLAAIDEKLGNYEDAEKSLLKLTEINPENRELLADFYTNRGKFESEAATLEKVLNETAETAKKLRIFEKLIENSRLHDLPKYRQPQFFQAFLAANPQSFPVLENLLEELKKDGNYAEALKVLRESKGNFPSENEKLLGAEIELLLLQGNSKEAENVYQQSFNPFWSEETTQSFYYFLSDQDRFRAYGAELRRKFKENPADYQTAIRLIHFQNYDRNESANFVISRLETARKEKKIEWQTTEIITIARLAIASGDGDTAARFLYTLHTNNAFKTNSELRAKTLYQLFELLADAENQRLALTTGDLKFYADIAESDQNPGIATGILSLIFSDANVAQEFEKKEETAVKFFNRTAAYRIFQTYKNENPESSPELAQMYLDLIRLYTATAEPAKAAELLTEFQAKFASENQNASAFPRLALKLADAFSNVEKHAEARLLFRQTLKLIGQNTEAGKLFAVNKSNNLEVKPKSDFDFRTAEKEKISTKTNIGINIPQKKKPNDYYYAPSLNFRDFLSDKNTEEITYSDVSERLLDSLKREDKDAEILAFYTEEITQYPNEERLYEQFSAWLETAKLAEKQLEIYQKAAQTFPTRTWQDRLARWFLAQKREGDFLVFSRELLNNADEERTQNFLNDFVVSRLSAPDSKGFDANLYLSFYQAAHQKFPHNFAFAGGLMNFYEKRGDRENWRKIAAEHFFDSPEIRLRFIADLASKNELQTYLNEAEAKVTNNVDSIIYKLFRASAAIQTADFENAVSIYRELAQSYPNEYLYGNELVNLTRSFGQKNPIFLTEAAEISRSFADFQPIAPAGWRVISGEIRAELGDYQAAKNEWQKIIKTAKGANETYLDTATLFWDYFQYAEAREIIQKLRAKQSDTTLYAFQLGAIYEAENDLPNALREYVKSLDALADDDEKAEQSRQSQARLTHIFKRGNNARNLRQIIANERTKRKSAAGLVLAFAEILNENELKNEAATLLKSEISRTDSPDFLEHAKEIFDEIGDENGAKVALQKLVSAAKSPKNRISAGLNLAQFLSEKGKIEAAANALSELSENFPTNYGVLRETADFYWRIGKREASLKVLLDASNRAKGEYRYEFARKAAARLVGENRLNEAENILQKLHAENPRNTEVFGEAANIFIRQKNPEKLRKAFAETLNAIKTDTASEPKEIRIEVANLRNKAIYAFTKLQDYRSAIAQHIEIINREPENEAHIEAAIQYAKRYGGGDVLRDYYEKTAKEAFKNYRWFVILARIAEANGELESAMANYEKAIENQPEMIELYLANIAILKKLNNLARCAEIYAKVLELSNNEPKYLKPAIENLEKLGRKTEADVLREKLPPETKPKINLEEQFSEARKLRFAENAKSAEAFAEAFEELIKNPLAHEIKAADLNAFVETSRREKSLTEITPKIWKLREKLLAEAEKSDSKKSNEARKLLQALDNALPDALGNVAKLYGTGEELTTLFADLETRISAVEIRNDKYETLAMLQNTARKSGFGALEEKILLKRKDANFAAGKLTEFHQNLQTLLDFYTSRGAFENALNLLEKERLRDVEAKDFSYIRQIAENARLLDQTETELVVLREYFNNAGGNLRLENDDLTARYLEILAEKGGTGREELREIAGKKSPFYLQIVNFFIARKDAELAHLAIENTPFSADWRKARHAETILALREFAPARECFFTDALQLAPIGELVLQKPIPNKDLLADDWFQIAQNYGVWLGENKEKLPEIAGENECLANMKPRISRKFMVAQIENRPQDFNEQDKLGVSYLAENEAKNALEHLQIAAELDGDNFNIKAKLGEAFFKTGEPQKARKTWAQTIESKSLEGYLTYQKTLTENGLEREANETLLPLISDYFKDFGNREDDFYGNDENGKLKAARIFFRAFAKNFRDEKAKAVYLQKLCVELDENFWLPEMIVEENLVAPALQNPFYEIVINRAADLQSYERDSALTETLQTTFNLEEAENLLDQETNYAPEIPKSEKLEFQAKYIAKLFQENDLETARKIVGEVEEDLKARFVRPNWLRLAKIRLAGNSLESLKSFVGISVNESAPNVNLPSFERLNIAIEIFDRIGDRAKIENLKEAFYLRNLAFEKFEYSGFAELAKINFRRGNKGFALELLQKAVALADAETSERAKAEIAAWQAVKNYAVDRAKVAESDVSQLPNLNEILKLSAEITAEFANFGQAIEFRQKLRAVAPEDFENRLKLARTYLKIGNMEATQSELLQMLNDRNAPRKARWEAVMFVYENAEISHEAVEKLKNEIQNDTEMKTAMEAGWLAKNGKPPEAQTLFNQYVVTNPNAFAETFGAKLNNSGEGLIRALIAEKDADFIGEKPLETLMRIYAQNGQPRAVLKIAETLELKEDLAKLAADSAEKIGNFANAVSILQKRKETPEIKQKIELLQAKISQENAENANRLIIDENVTNSR